MQQVLLGVLLPLGGELRVTPPHQSLEHQWPDSCWGLEDTAHNAQGHTPTLSRDGRDGWGDLLSYWRLLSCCLTSTEARWPIRDGDSLERGWEWRLDRGNHPKKTGETVDRRQNNGSVMVVSPCHCPATCALHNCCAGQVTKTMSVALLLTNNLDNSKQKRSNLLSPAPPPYSWSLLGKCEGPAHLPPLRPAQLLCWTGH